MSNTSDQEDDGGAAHPRETSVLFGHTDAEETLLTSYGSGRIPHAWLIGGPRGIGKATLAYRMARFLFAHPDPAATAVQAATSLQIDARDPVARRVAVQGQGDLLVLERGLNEKGRLRQDIAVEDVRRTVSFFGSTAWEGGWRVAIVDSVEELNPSGENALLKVLEEPPPRSLLLLVSHAPGRVLPTIRSRCRKLMLRPLDTVDVARAVAAALGCAADEPEVRAAAEAAEGSVARALALLDGTALSLRQRVLDLLAALPSVNGMQLHGLGDALAGTDAGTLSVLVDTVNGWLSAQLNVDAPEPARLARLAEVWEKFNSAARDVGEYNLERKPLVFTTFEMLADASRG